MKSDQTVLKEGLQETKRDKMERNLLKWADNGQNRKTPDTFDLLN